MLKTTWMVRPMVPGFARWTLGSPDGPWVRPMDPGFGRWSRSAGDHFSIKCFFMQVKPQMMWWDDGHLSASTTNHQVETSARLYVMMAPISIMLIQPQEPASTLQNLLAIP